MTVEWLKYVEGQGRERTREALRVGKGEARLKGVQKSESQGEYEQQNVGAERGENECMGHGDAGK